MRANMMFEEFNRQVLINLDRINGEALEIPRCPKCGKPLRPNVTLKYDNEFLEDK